MDKKDSAELKRALGSIERLAPKLYGVIKNSFYIINCKKRTDIEQIKSVTKIYLYAKGISLTPRATELLIMFIKYDTGTESRKKIRRQINMTPGTLNQNASNLKKAGVLIYPYADSKKSVIDPALIKLREYIVKGTNSNILIKYND